MIDVHGFAKSTLGLACLAVAFLQVGCSPSSSSSSGSAPGAPPSQTLLSTFFGGAGGERVQGVWVLHNGDVLVTGETTSDFAAQPEFPQPALPFFDQELNNDSPGTTDGFVAVLSPDLTQIKYWTYLGGDASDRAYFAMEDPTSSEHDIWVCGFTGSGCFCAAPCEPFPVFPPGNCFKGASGSCNANAPDTDVFVTRLSRDLRQLKSSLVIGGRYQDGARGSLWVDASPAGGVYVTGVTASDDFFTNVAGGEPQATTGCSGGVAITDAFVLALDANGALVWSRCLGGAHDDSAFGGVRSSADGASIFVAGVTNSSDFGPGGLPGFDWVLNQNGVGGGWRDGFVSKLRASDASVEAWTFIGGSRGDGVGFNDCFELDPSGRPVVYGSTRSSDLPLAGAPLSANHSNGVDPPDEDDSDDLFVAVFDPALTTLRYSSYVNRLGQSSANRREEPSGLAIDGSGDIYLSGETLSPAFPVTPLAFDSALSTSGRNDAFIVRLSPSFDPQGISLMRYASFLGGDHHVGFAAEEGSRGRCLSIVPPQGALPGHVIVSGQTTTDDFPVVSPDGGGTVVFPAWLSGDQRQGFIAVLGTP